MTLEQAIKTALEYETKVRDAYLDGVEKIADSEGRRVFEVMGREEQGHVDYLEALLADWKKTGKLSPARLETVVPSRDTILKGVERLDGHLSTRDYGTEREMLKKALALEEETSDFYRKMVAEMKENADLFSRFLEIEEGHLAVVQAELDYLNQTGRFFNFEEFNLEY